MKLSVVAAVAVSRSLSFLVLVGTMIPSSLVQAQADVTLALNASTVHWGFFSKVIDPVLTVPSGTVLTVEMATHHACDDWDKMIKGDPGMEDIYTWTTDGGPREEFRGATGGGDGVHILTGPIFVEEAEPGDVLKVEILELQPRKNPLSGKTYGSNAAAWWGFQARVPLQSGEDFTAGNFSSTPDSNDEVITIYEVMDQGDGSGYAFPIYQFEWPTLTDPQGTKRNYIQYPGTCVAHQDHCGTEISSDVADMGWAVEGDITYYDEVYQAKIPINYHVGCMGLAPASHDYVDSIPPMPTGGNLDNKRIGVGTVMYYPVEVPGGMLSMGDAHAAQGDSELDGTGIETSITGTFRVTVLKKDSLSPALASLDSPLGETASEWIVHGFTETDYLAAFPDDPSKIYGESDLNKSMKNAFTQTRKFLMAEYDLTEYEAWTIITQGADFGITQVVDGNWGVHAVVPKLLFDELSPAASTMSNRKLAGHGGADYTLSLSADNVHWGYFSKTLTPALTVPSGSEVTIEMATHHACDDWDKMIKGDPGMEDVYHWNGTFVGEGYRGATGGGDGVHVLTGPVFIEGAEPGDLLKVEILDLMPRINPNGKTYGSNAAAWWGFQARVPLTNGADFTAGNFTDTPDSNDEVVTIYELVEDNGKSFAVPSYQFEWPVITDPNGVTRNFIQYPGTCVPHSPHGGTEISSDVADMGWSASGITYYDDVFRARIPVNFHVGCMGLAPASHDFVDSIPPMPTGGNLDNKRLGVGMTMYYPVEVAGALFSAGDAHAAQGDSELDGTGIETSITGKFKFTVVKPSDFTPGMATVDFPLGSTDTEWIIHGYTETDYLETYKENPGDIYANSDINKAMKNAFSQTRDFLMAEYDLTEYEAWTIITTGVDFATTQLVDGNWGVHAVVPKSLFDVENPRSVCQTESPTFTTAAAYYSHTFLFFGWEIAMGIVAALFM